MKKKKILVIGGTGVTGKLIAQDLKRHLWDRVTITLASRNVLRQDAAPPDDFERIMLDIYRQEEAVEKVQGYDLVVIACGPFGTYGLLPYQICMLAKVDCLDINDEISVTDALYRAKDMVCDSGIRIFTGMGLNPGLMTFQILRLLEVMPHEEAKEIDMKLFIGGRQEAGFAAVHVMLDGFHKKVPVIRNGTQQLMQAIDRKEAFSPMGAAIPFFHCPTAQISSFAENHMLSRHNIDELDFKIHFQGMSPWMVKTLRSTQLLKKKKVKDVLANLIFRSQKSLQMKSGNIEESISCITCTQKRNGTISSSLARGLSSYELTARFASAITELILMQTDRRSGIYSVEDLDIPLDAIERALTKRAISIQEEIGELV